MKMTAMALFAIVVAFGFTACSSNDDEEESIYTMGFSTTSFSGSTLTGMASVMKAIEKPYKEAFGSDSYFKYCCDSKVKEACEAAEKKVTIDWGDGTGTFVYEVTNQTKNKVVYSKTFTNAAE